MRIKKFNKAVENSGSVIQNLYEMRGAVIFLLRPQTREKSRMGRNHKVVHKIARFFQSKIISTSYKSWFNSITYNGLIIWLTNSRERIKNFDNISTPAFLLPCNLLYMANLSGVFHSGYQLDFKIPVTLRFVLIGQRLQGMLTFLG